jgi:hypothetical protein
MLEFENLLFPLEAWSGSVPMPNLSFSLNIVFLAIMEKGTGKIKNKKREGKRKVQEC